MSAEVILTRLGLLAGDEEADILPHFQRVFPVLLDLISAAGRTGQQDADLLEHASECLTYLLKYRARYVINELPKYLEQYAVLLKHKKIRIRHFSAQNLALVYRRISTTGMRAAVSDTFQLLGRTENLQDLELMADGLSVLLAKTVTGVQRQFRSKTMSVLRPLLRAVQRSAFTDAQRAAQLRTIRMSLLRMRNHARSLDAAADVVEAIFGHFRAAAIRYVNATKGVKNVEGASKQHLDEDDSESESEDEAETTKENLQQEVLFYFDLVVSWVYAKPRPRDCYGESWQAFAAVAVECFTAIVEAGNLTSAETSPATTDEEKKKRASFVSSFPPVTMPVSEAGKRAFLLLWRAMPSIVAPLCTEKLAAVFAGPDQVDAQSALLSCGNDDA